MPFPVDNIRQVCKEQGTSLAEVERALKIGNGVIAKWEKNKGYPPYDRIVEIANFLNTPISRLTGASGEKSPSQGDGLSLEQQEIMDLFDALDPADRAAWVATAKALIAARKSQGDR